MKAPTIFSILLAFLILATPALAEENSTIPTDSAPDVPRPSLQAVRHARKSPCLGMYGADLRRCVMRNNFRVQETESRRTQMLKRSSTFGRRLMSLQRRLKNQTSVLDDPATGKKVDLRARTLYRRNLLRDRGSERSYAKTSDGPLVQVRTKAGDRKTATSLPVCARRDGLRLIRCMQDMGVEINKETVDHDTWKIYQRIYMR